MIFRISGWILILSSYCAGPASAVSRLARGRYLTEAVLQCFDCHSERDTQKPGWPPKKGRKGAGRVLGKDLVAPNITPDRPTGAGDWTDAQFLRALREGIGHDGRTLSPVMGSMYYRQMTLDDALSVVAYLRTLPPVNNPLPANPKSSSAPPSYPKAPAVNRLATPVEAGRYLIAIAGCASCHTPFDKNGPLPGMFLAGGFMLTHEGRSAAAANLTPDASGISYYDDGMFIEVMRTGKIGGRKISPIMPWFCFRNMADSDLKAMFAYLKTIPPVKHRVDNGEPVSGCPLCGFRHGLGNTNPPRSSIGSH